MPEWLSSDDYAEPRCPLCMDTSGRHTIPRDRVMEKFDEYTHRDDYDGAQKHMLYWLEEAKLGRDLQGQFQICNELMGLFRKTGQKDAALAAVRDTMALIQQMHTEDTVSAATAYLNAATVYDAFGLPERSLPLFQQAEKVYKANLAPCDPRFGGLYNNMGLALAALERYDEANDCYRRALDVMAHAKHGEAEQAITYLNIADAVYARLGAECADETVNAYLDKAQRLLDADTLPRDGNYAFVCEKCAPTFTYYGRFAYGAELKERAETIYAGT